jgi:hypothetical protein
MTPKESEEVSRKVLEMTPEEWEEFRRRTKAWLERGQKMEPQTLSAPSPPGPVTCEVKIKGDGTGFEILGDEGLTP